MSTIYIMPNGEAVPVPQDVVAQGRAAEQGFYDLQLERIKTETAPGAPAKRIKTEVAPASPAGSDA